MDAVAIAVYPVLQTLGESEMTFLGCSAQVSPGTQCKCIIWRLDRILRIHSLQVLSCCRCQETSAPVGVEVGASPKALWVVLGMWLLAFHSERFKSQSEEDTLPSRIWPLSPTWLLLLNFIFLKSISKFTLKRSKAWFQKILSINSETIIESNWLGLRNIKDILTAFIEMFKVRLGRYGSLGYVHAAQRWAPEFD